MMAEEAPPSHSRVVGICPSYEPHIWRRNKCKNCFHTKSEHKRAVKTQQSFLVDHSRDDPSLHLDFVDGTNHSDNDFTPRIEGDKTRKDYKEELRQLRRERKEIAMKQAELRETMLRMEVQMHDYKETKQENDILTKDILLMKKDLREVTQGASKACEMNEKLRKEVSRLRAQVRSLGGDPHSTNENLAYDSESAADSDYSLEQKREPAELVVESEPEIKPKTRLERRGMKKKDIIAPTPENGSSNVTPLSRTVRERMARMEEHLSSLRSVCISITNTPPNVCFCFHCYSLFSFYFVIRNPKTYYFHS